MRISGGDGILLTTGQAALQIDPEMGTWTGIVQTLRGTAVAGKALIVDLEIPDGGTGRAQLTPHAVVGDRAQSRVSGLSAPPF
ncbi:MAG: hypothetical protein PVG83_07155 [Acidimicrobiia bacterium]